MTHSIFVFNSTEISIFSPDDILSVITRSNLHTLCQQYGISEELIPQALDALRVEVASEGNLFALHISEEKCAPLIVSQTSDRESIQKIIRTIPPGLSSSLTSALLSTQRLVVIDLLDQHLRNLGLLFAYELARRAAFEGQGVIYGLDQRWYRLNCHQAFIPA